MCEHRDARHSARRSRQQYGDDYRVKRRKKQSDAKSAALLKQALKEALPYEPVKKKRIKGKYYWRPDGQLARWDGFKLNNLRFQPEAKHNGEASSSSDPLPSEQPDEQPDAPME